MAATGSSDKITVPSITQRKGGGTKIVALTAYDYTMARLLDSARVDIILVGDSLGSVIQGRETTLPVTLQEVIYHSACVSRGVTRALVVGDMPFLSYQVSVERAIESAGQLLKDGGVSAVKLEGGVNVSGTISRLVALDIPVMGHIGLTPQSYHRMGGHKVQGREGGDGTLRAGTRERIIEDALAVEKSGAFSMVIEGVPEDLAAEITGRISIPTIGIGAGRFCDGQILVTHDMLGFGPAPSPKFVKRYAEFGSALIDAVTRYGDEVKSGIFPGQENSFGAKGSGSAKRRKSSGLKLV